MGVYMKTYKVTGAVARFAPGSILELTPEQYADRKMYLDSVKGKEGHYRVLQTVEFKQGEEVGFGGKLDKVTRLAIALADGSEPEIGTDDTDLDPDGEIDLEELSNEELVSIAGQMGIKDVRNLDRDSLILVIMEKSEENAGE